MYKDIHEKLLKIAEKEAVRNFLNRFEKVREVGNRRYDLPKIRIRPILDFRLKIPFVEVVTRLLTDRYDMNIKEYVMLHVRLFDRWEFRFKLYNTYERRIPDPETLTIHKKRSI